jgi:hypothetical protein
LGCLKGRGGAGEAAGRHGQALPADAGAGQVVADVVALDDDGVDGVVAGVGGAVLGAHFGGVVAGVVVAVAVVDGVVVLLALELLCDGDGDEADGERKRRAGETVVIGLFIQSILETTVT